MTSQSWRAALSDVAISAIGRRSSAKKYKRTQVLLSSRCLYLFCGPSSRSARAPAEQASRIAAGKKHDTIMESSGRNRKITMVYAIYEHHSSTLLDAPIHDRLSHYGYSPNHHRRHRRDTTMLREKLTLHLGFSLHRLEGDGPLT